MPDSFQQTRSSSISSLRVRIHEYTHVATGARHLHFETDDANNGFVVAFLTVPTDSTGVAHILEHTSLCGSEKFPIRDPFFMMLRRSLATFMNAFTSSDWTAYPFATQNPRDFDNLLRVYLDAVFFPRLDVLDFAQEGHRLEPEDPGDPSSPLTIRGVVYNEMKGVLSQPTSRLYQTMQSHLFPTTTYHHNHGGDPARIPDLTHEDLVRFHARHYHPSNAVFMTWGDLHVQDHHQRIHELALCRFSSQQIDLALADETRYTAPVTVEASYPISPQEQREARTHVVLGWLLGRSTDMWGMMNAQLVSDVLLAHSASPLRKVLETTDLGTSPSALTGLSSSTREASFYCGIEGSEPGRAEAVESLIVQTLSQVAEDGVDPDEAEAVLHQLELSQREVGGGDFPYGLQIMLRALPAVLHGGDAVAFLDIDPVVSRLRERIADPAYIGNLVRELLVENPHRVRLTMSPDPDLAPREADEERERIQDLAQRIDDGERQQLVARAVQLEKRQAEKGDPEVLPRVTRQDIPARVPHPEGQTRTVGDVQTTWFPTPTNGIAYMQVAVDLPSLPDHLLDLLSLFTTCLTEVGSGGRSYLQTQALQMAVSGGVGARTRVRGRLDDVHALSSFFSTGTKALQRNIAPASSVLAETFESPRFDELSRLRELVAQILAIRLRGLVGQGHALVMKAASAALAPQAALGHRLSGLPSIRVLRGLADSFTDRSGLETFASGLSEIARALRSSSRRVVLVGEEDHRDALLEAARSLAPGPGEKPACFTLHHTPAPVRQAWTTSMQVSFCARAHATVCPAHPDAAALTLLGPLLQNGYLHTAVRERGGAYGSGAGYDADSGTFRFFSYRDPRLGGTLEDFEKAVAWVTTEKVQDRLLEEALLTVIGRIDRPDPPAGEAIGTYYQSLHGRTPAVRMRHRERLLAVTLDDVRRVASTYLGGETASVAVLTDPSRLEAEPELELTRIDVQ